MWSKIRPTVIKKYFLYFYFPPPYHIFLALLLPFSRKQNLKTNAPGDVPMVLLFLFSDYFILGAILIIKHKKVNGNVR